MSTTLEIGFDRSLETRQGRASVLLFPGPFDSLVGRMHYRSVHDMPLIEVVHDSTWRKGSAVRRGSETLGPRARRAAAPTWRRRRS